MSSTSPAPRVYRLHRKERVSGERGIPKYPADSVFITPQGVQGDFNRWRQEKAGGDPQQALLLLPLEILSELNAEGWPLAPGELGENVTTVDLDPRAFGVGRRLRLGEEVEVVISKPCPPCRNLAALSSVGEARVVEIIRTLAGRRGWYASVLTGGWLFSGDSIQLL